MHPLGSTPSFLSVLLLGAATSLAACGDDSGGSGGGGGEAPTGTTTSSTAATTTGSSTSSASSGGTGGEGTGGGGTGGEGTGGGGTGGGEPAECTDAGAVDDTFEMVTELEVDGGHYECTVDGVEQDTPTTVTTLSCIQGDVAFFITLGYFAEPALTGEFPLAPGQEVTLDAISENPDDPPVSVAYVVRRAADQKLLFAWIDGGYIAPPGAEGNWASPLALTEVDGLCTPDADDYERRAMDVVLGADAPVRVFSDHVALLTSDTESFEIRVTQNTYNAEISGGWNSRYLYAILAPPSPLDEP